jgi:D-sedoheptulose 7-phosphate isomerase
MQDRFLKEYMQTLESAVTSAAVTDIQGKSVGLEAAVRQAGAQMRGAHDRGNGLFFIGNGGSAGISSHMATDYSKNGGMRASSLTDGSVVTCLGNDYGYEHIFGKQIEWHCRAGDILIAISSSGRSKNILNGVRAARERNCTIFTLSGFTPDNPLRAMGDLNFYVANKEYGFVEVGHLALLHSVLDIQMGWQPASVKAPLVSQQQN